MTCFARFAALFLVAVFAGIGTASAADYPNKPVKSIVPYPPGGTTDVLARSMAHKGAGPALVDLIGGQVQGVLRQPVVVGATLD